MPFQRQSNKLQKWDLESASIVFRAHLIFYSNNFNHPEIIKYFDHLSKYLGYWCFDNRTKKWLIDFHGYSYDEVTFALYHILRRRVDELVNKMGFDGRLYVVHKNARHQLPKSFNQESNNLSLPG
eukprot:254148_1